MAAGLLLEDRREPVLLQQVHGRLGRGDQAIVFSGREPEQLDALLERGLSSILPLRRLPVRCVIGGWAAGAAAAAGAGWRQAQLPVRRREAWRPGRRGRSCPEKRREAPSCRHRCTRTCPGVERRRAACGCRPSTGRQSPYSSGRSALGSASRRTAARRVRSRCTNSSVAGPAARAAAGRGDVWPAGITTIIGFAFLSAIRLSRMKPARPTDAHASSLSPGAVQQVEDRVLAAPRLVAGRRVDVHPAETPQRGRVVGHLGDRAVRHVPRVRRPPSPGRTPGSRRWCWTRWSGDCADRSSSRRRR